jgi:hypothetical protein
MAVWDEAETAVIKRRIAMGNMRLGFMDPIEPRTNCFTQRHERLHNGTKKEIFFFVPLCDLCAFV